MQVTVVEVLPDHSIIEYEDADGYIQRRIIHQGLMRIIKKGPANLPDDVLSLGMEYSNVDLVQALGEELPPIRVQELQDRLRRAGLWTQKDYEANLSAVNGVWQRLRGVDATLISNAALRKLG